MRLTEREIKAITPMKLPSLQKGSDLKWFAENSPKIDHLRGTNTPKDFYKFLRREFAPQNLNELQIRRTLDYAGFNTYATPEGLPKNIVVELAKKKWWDELQACRINLRRKSSSSSMPRTC